MIPNLNSLHCKMKDVTKLKKKKKANHQTPKKATNPPKTKEKSQFSKATSDTGMQVSVFKSIEYFPYMMTQLSCICSLMILNHFEGNTFIKNC